MLAVVAEDSPNVDRVRKIAFRIVIGNHRMAPITA